MDPNGLALSNKPTRLDYTTDAERQAHVQANGGGRSVIDNTPAAPLRPCAPPFVSETASPLLPLPVRWTM